MTRNAQSAKRALGDQEVAEWLKKRQLARRSLIAKRARSGKRASGDQEGAERLRGR